MPSIVLPIAYAPTRVWVERPAAPIRLLSFRYSGYFVTRRLDAFAHLPVMGCSLR
jgi:hypothetical protein